MSEVIRFRAKLLRNHVIQIPKRVVELNRLWVGTRVRIRIWLGNHYADFETTVKRRFRFTIPHLEFAGSSLRRGDIVGVTLEVR